MAFDSKKVTTWVQDLIKRCNDSDMKKMPKVHKMGILADEFPEFFETSPSLFKKVIFDEDLSWLNQFIKYNKKIESGQTTLNDAELELGQQLGDKYLPEDLKKNAPKTETILSESEQILRRDALVTFFKNRILLNDMDHDTATKEIESMVSKGHIPSSVLDYWISLDKI
jgi:hypothetical protein